MVGGVGEKGLGWEEEEWAHKFNKMRDKKVF